MKYGSLPGIDKPLSRLVQGAMMLVSDDQEAMFANFDAIHAMGCTVFDTAHGYGGGDVDRALGAWINARGVRDKVVILGKGAHPYKGEVRVTPEHITSDLNESLERMQVDHIDLYILHRDNPEVPVGPLVEVLNQHKQEGRISVFGGSNWTPERLQEANDYAVAHGLTPFQASSVQCSLAEMVNEPWPDCLSVNASSRDWYLQNQMPIFNWSSLAGGFMTGRFRRDNLDSFDKEDYWAGVAIHGYASEDNFKRLDRAEELAKEKGVSLPQLALAYVLNQPLNLFPLVGCREAAEFEANAAALEIELSEAEQAWLDLRQATR